MRIACLLLAILGAGCGGAHEGVPGADAGDVDLTSGDPGDMAGAAPDGAGAPDAAVPADAGALATLSFTCSTPPAANPCPAPSGAAGQASFCFRPQWRGVTKVEVFIDRGGAGDWTTPFVTLTDDGTGTFTGSAALANGSYPYLYRTSGSVDGLVKDKSWFLDQLNPSFVPPTAGAPVQRSLSSVTVPQVAAPIHHLTGTLLYAGAPQPCFAIDLEAGELRSGGMVVSEHTHANYVESGPDGRYDFPVADGELGVVVRYPYGLVGATYPDPMATPSIGYARTSTTMAAADLVLDALDVSYPHADYVAMSPTGGGTATLPVTLQASLIPDASAISFAVIATNIAGNDPAYWSAMGSQTSLTWDGTLGGGGKVQSGKTYWWGTWQKRGGAAGDTWSVESLLFPVTF